jgi:hypothetical protein
LKGLYATMAGINSNTVATMVSFMIEEVVSNIWEEIHVRSKWHEVLDLS